MIVNKMSVPVLGKLKDQNGNILFTEVRRAQAHEEKIISVFTGRDTKSSRSLRYQQF